MAFSFKKSAVDGVRDSKARKALLLSGAYWLATLLYLELLLHAVAFGMPDAGFGLTVGFSVVFACVLTLLTSLVSKNIRFAVMMVLTVFLVLLYGSQMVYHFVFGTLYTVAQMQQGGAAITSFWKETLLTMGKHVPEILLLLIPVVALIVLKKLCPAILAPMNWVWRVSLVVLAVLAQLISIQCLQIGGTGYFTNYYFYHNDSATTDQATQRFGLLTAFRLNLFGSEQSVTQKEPEKETYYIPEVTTESTAQTQPEGEEQPVEPPPVLYNVLDIDFQKLSQMTDDDRIQAINQYCANVSGTKQNAYTGMLKDYNLIVLCAESFSAGAIHPELTPTLYKMVNEGFVFNNFYNTYPNNTTDGEYTLCMGLYPDFSRGKSISSFYASRRSYWPFSLANMFSQQRGIQSYGYHNYEGTYYGRYESHPNLGYNMKFAGDGMYFTTAWPASDLEMMEQSVDDYISADSQFHAYYMTFSGHLIYDPDGNPMAARNWAAVQWLQGYSDAAKSYLACNIELDKALAYLMQRLEEEGVADKTAIVLVGDHYPYGLYDDQYSQLVGYQVDKFTKYKSNMIFWVGGMKEPVQVDEYCCNADVLPTILNLWGFQYDSRMLAGTDVFSDGTHIAILTDKSFFTDKVWLDASTGEVRYLVDEASLPEGYVEKMIKLVETKFSLSANILNTAYYNFVFEKGQVAIDRYTWEINLEPEGTEAP